MAAPDSPPGEYTETRDGKRRGLGRGGSVQSGEMGENDKRRKEGGCRSTGSEVGSPDSP